MQGEAIERPSESLGGGVPASYEEIEHQVPQEVFAQLLALFSSVLEEKSKETLPNFEIRPNNATRLGAVPFHACANFLHHSPTVCVEMAEMLPRFPLQAKAKRAEHPPQWIVKALESNLLRSVEGHQKGRRRILQGTCAFPEANLGDTVQRETVHEAEDVHLLPYSRSVQNVAKLASVSSHDGPNVLLENTRGEHLARGLTLTKPNVTIGVEDALAQKIRELPSDPRSFRIVHEICL
mmetsp:Transcript_21069/g.58869  ORF Transcript_21069/g.58869 Transcript_21069/m.58869 type:complete len:237 (-) Transcript_21069:371-1081(-)